MGKQVVTTCLSILNDGADVSVLNHTVVVLIPKNKNPQAVFDYRPISLCNVIYRILAKVLANRLKGVLDVVISCSQSAFIPNRLITDNFILGYECLHKLRSCKSRKGGIIALKLDISKAYERVEWIFLENVMIRLGFSERWVKLILACVMNSTFSFMINGEIQGMVRPQRGLRQGCPLSPYLFILCAKAFSSLIHVAETANLIREVRFSKDLMVSHLFFCR